MSKKIRVMQLGNPKGLYGAERWILALIKYLDPTEIDTWVGAIKDEQDQNVPLCIEAQKLGFTTHIFHSYGRVSLSAAYQLRHFIIKNSIDILHTHGYKTDLIGIMAVRKTKCKIVSTPHGWTNKPGLRLAVYELLDRFIFNWFDAVVPLSVDLYKPLKKHLISKQNVHLIQNGVDVGEIDSYKDTSNVNELKTEKSDYIIGYIGRLTHGKGLDILLKALSLNNRQNWRLVIVGEGDQREELESLSKHYNLIDRTLFTGYREDRIMLLKLFDVFILPSKSEGIPRCIMEAMAAGIPVVASDIPGCRYLVTDMENGLLFRQNNPEMLVNAIKRIQDDPELKNLIISNGRRMIIKNFTSEGMAGEYMNIYKNLIYEKQN